MYKIYFNLSFHKIIFLIKRNRFIEKQNPKNYFISNWEIHHKNAG